MDRACDSSYPGSRAALLQQLVEGFILKLPPAVEGEEYVFKCGSPECLRGDLDHHPSAYNFCTQAGANVIAEQNDYAGKRSSSTPSHKSFGTSSSQKSQPSNHPLPQSSKPVQSSQPDDPFDDSDSASAFSGDRKRDSREPTHTTDSTKDAFSLPSWQKIHYMGLDDPVPAKLVFEWQDTSTGLPRFMDYYGREVYADSKGNFVRHNPAVRPSISQAEQLTFDVETTLQSTDEQRGSWLVNPPRGTRQMPSVSPSRAVEIDRSQVQKRLRDDGSPYYTDYDGNYIFKDSGRYFLDPVYPPPSSSFGRFDNGEQTYQMDWDIDSYPVSNLDSIQNFAPVRDRPFYSDSGSWDRDQSRSSSRSRVNRGSRSGRNLLQASSTYLALISLKLFPPHRSPFFFFCSSRL